MQITSEANIPTDGEIAQELAKWFDSPIGDLPPQPRSIVEAYIPDGSELSAADRRARADEADHRRWVDVCERIERANREKDQAENDPRQAADGLVGWYAVTLDAMTWWKLGSVTPREAAMLLCRFNPHDDKLDPLSITADETAPEDFKRLVRVFEDVEQAKPQAHTLSEWHDFARSKRLKYHSWIDAFRQAVTEIAPTTDTPPQGQIEAARSGAPERTAPVTMLATEEADATALPASNVRHQNTRPPGQQRHQETEILRVISELGYKAYALPKRIPGKRSVKADVMGRLRFHKAILDKAWQRLSGCATFFL